ncbi:MAG TPA: ATP-binding protein [Gemmatimonadaceae bacterium]
MSEIVFPQIGQERSRRLGDWLSSLKSNAVAIGALASYALFRLIVNSGRIAERPSLSFDWLIFVAAHMCMVFWSFRAFAVTRDDPRTSRAWLLIGMAAVGSTVASSAETVLEILYHQVQLPLWIHLLFAAVYLTFAAGLLSFPIAPRRRTDRITLSFDIATVALSGMMVFWYWSVRTGVFDPTTTLANKAIVIGYPSADLALLLTSAILLVRSVDNRSRSIFGFMALGYLGSSIADFSYGYLQMGSSYQRNTALDVCWFAGVVLPIFAAVSQLKHSARPDAPRREAARWMAEIPTIAVALAFAILFLAIRENREDVKVQLGVGALVMTMLAIARQRISARDATRLVSDRASRDARFRALVQNSSDVVIVLDASLRATYVSPAIQGVLGLDSELGVGRTFVEWVAPEDREEAAMLLARAAATPSATESLRCRMVHADGTLRTMETQATNLLDDPAVRGIVLNSRDITRRAALEAQVQHTQKLEVVGQLAGGIAHDFNNLLMVIGANAEFVLSDEIDPTARREAAAEIKDTTKRAAALTKQLLAFSRRQETRPVIINPNDIVRHVERMLLRLMQHAAHVEVDLTDALSSIEIDPGQLEQALLNLAVNARDSMPAGGLLRIRTRNVTITERTTVDRGILTPGDYVAISVEDNGSGMRADVRSRIFEPFFTTKPIGSGTGLGLAMVLAVVHQANGQVLVQSTQGEGTRITLYFPLIATTPKQLVERPQASALRGTGRILVVDDEEGVRTVLQRLLRRIGYEVDAVGDANTALAMLAVTPLRFDLVLSDITMPEKTGLELATELIDGKIPVAIVLMTGFADNATVSEASLTHRLPVLRKPFEVEELAVIIEEALSHRCDQPDGC